MFKLSHSSTILRALIAIVATITTTIVGVFLIRTIIIANAITGSGEPVTIIAHDYYELDDVDGNHYKVSVDGSTFEAFCAQPSLGNPEGISYAQKLSSGSDTYNLIKLMIYIYQHNPTARNYVLSAWDSSEHYIWAHMVIGVLYSNDYKYISTTNVNNVNAAITKLRSYYASNNSVWAAASNYQLYLAPGHSSGLQDVVWIEGNAQYGSINVQKCDSASSDCKTQGGANLGGIEFKVYNNSGRTIYNPAKNAFYNNGDVVATGTTNTSGALSFTNLLANNVSYIVKETATNASYEMTASQQTITLNGNGDSENLRFNNQVKRGNVKFVKKDEDNDKVMANVPFRITSKTTGENHIVVTDSNGRIDTSAVRHSQNTNGYDSLTSTQLFNVTYQGYGTWFGVGTTVDDSLGALPYDEYEIVELECDRNKFCYDITSEKQSFSITSNGEMKDLGTWENHCASFSLETEAVDKADNDKFVEANSSATIKDTIKYCAKEDMTYKLVGTLMDKTTNRVVKTVTIDNFKPSTACGTTTMDFTIDASAIAGHDLVVFEKMYYGDELVASHEDINDAAQTVYIISLGTTATDTHDGDRIIYNAITESNIKDTIDYCLKAGEHYKIKGILMDKSTRQPLLVNGSEITATKEINPTTACGTTSMIFDIDVTWLGGTEVVVFETVEYDNHDIISHEDFDDESQTIDIVSLSTLATDDSDGDHIIFDEQAAKIRDVVDYCLIPGKTYTINSVIMDGKNGLPLKINGEKIESSTEITPTKNCDYVELYFDIDPAEIAGHNIVMFEDLYYNDHLVLEHNTLFDNYETINVLSLTTTATDLEDGDKLMAANRQVTITDKVDYCLLEDETFTIKGVVMNKTTKEILLINGAPVEQTITITPEEKCGSVNMEYTLDTTGLGGNELVIFESLYYDDDLIIAHRDFDNEPETVSVLIPAPDTGLFTKADWEDKEELSAPIIPVVIAVAPIIFLDYMIVFKKLISNRHRVDFK